MISRRWNTPSVHHHLSKDRDESQPREREVSPISSSILEENLRNPRLLMIHGELIALTGDPRTAAILGQLLYWSQQVNDFDLFLEEESHSYSKDHVFQHGWFCKPVIALMEETMFNVTMATFRRYLRFLIDRKWVQTRPHPQNKWTGGRQYRVNLRTLNFDLQKKGYSLPDYSVHGMRLSSKQIFCEQENDSGRNS